VDDSVEELQRRAAPDPQVIRLGGGLPAPEQFPRAPLARAFLRALDDAAAPALQYGFPEGSARLRRFVADSLQARGAAVDAGEVIITSGAQQALAIALEIACRPGDRVGVDRTTYPAALDLLRTRHLLPVVNGDESPRRRAVAAAPDAAAVRARYCMPALGNPSGRGLDLRARRGLLAGGGAIIEDDAYADLRFDGPAPIPLLALGRERVFHLGTWSKTLCPGLRVGWLVPPRRHLARALRIKRDSDLQANSMAQAIVDDYLASVDFGARLVRLRRFYRQRAARMARALTRHLPSWHFCMPQGGFAIWVEADVAADERALLDAAFDEGVVFDPGSQFRAGGAATPLAMRLCFSAVPADALEEGVRRLARAWRRLGERPRMPLTPALSPSETGRG
jgi:2-aminoadipate transaminase